MSKNRYQQRRKKNQRSPQQKPETAVNPARQENPKKNLIALIVILLAVVGFIVIYWNWPASNETIVQRVNEDFQAQLYPLVVEGVDTLLARKYPVDIPLLLKAAESSVKIQDGNKAVAFLERVDDQQGIVSVKARRFAFDILFDQGQAKACEQQIRRALALAPDDSSLNSRMGKLLNIMGRRLEAESYLMKVLENDEINWEELILLSNRFPNYEIGPAIDGFKQSDPNDPRAFLNDARLMVTKRKPAEGLELLDRIIAADPENDEARMWQGRALVALDDPAFADWVATLPESARDHPDYWLALGMWASDHEQPQAAMRCMWQVLRTDPENVHANYRLSTLLKQSKDQVELAQVFLDRSLTFFEFQHALDRLKEGFAASENIKNQAPDYEKDKDDLMLVADQLEQYGRRREAHAWYRQIGRLSSTAQRDVVQSVARLSDQIKTDTPRYLPGAVPANRIDFSHYPLPKIKASARDTGSEPDLVIAFVDQAKQAGIDFRFFNSTNENTQCLYLYSIMGGGVGILDYNLDGLPDIYVAQGRDWPVEAAQTTHLDRLYENRGDGTYRDVTAESTLIQGGFGQGVSVGDYNSDGFPDLYIANIHGNRLLQNNGDGSYSDVTSQAQLETTGWTASCLIADLNGDQLPDLYDVNYLGGKNVYTKTCGSAEKPFSCPPKDFEPLPDQLWLNLGDGTFREVGREIDLPITRGLGIVAGDVNNDGKLDLFVGNDTDPNLLLLNESEAGILKLKDVANEFGVDLAATGEPQACMGIAVTDFNHDEKIDFFVTNYWEESNTLYVSEEFGYSVGSRKANLSNPGFYNVGFGTQFLDMELDGDPDLYITNGHVQNYWTAEKPLQQSPLLLVNVGNGRFREFDAGELTDSKRLGRGLAKLDWNRDGLQDLVVTSLDQPLQLLTNRSKPQGGFVSLQLIGTRSARDPIGTRVTVTQNGQAQHFQLTAGDGFSVSNQRELVFATSQDQVDSIRVTWPSGTVQNFEATLSGRHYILIEGASELSGTN